MNRNNLNRGAATLFFAICTMASTGLVAQDKVAEKLPTAESVIAKYVKATGGLEKYKALKSVQQSGSISIPMAGISGTIDIKIAFPNKIRTRAVLPGVGTESGGSDGKTVWADTTTTGPRILKGKEKDQILMEADFRRMYDPASVYKSLKVTGIESIDGEDCYEVTVVKQNGDEQHDYFSIESGLQTYSKITVKGPAGDMRVDVTLSDYKEVDGIKMPFKLTQLIVAQNMSIEIEFDEVEINTPFKDGAFDLPENVKRLVEKNGQPKQGSGK